MLSQVDFSKYEMRPSDKESLVQSADALIDAGLHDEETLNGLCIMSYDHDSLYLLTRGEHQSTEKYSVEEISIQSRNGFRLHKFQSPNYATSEDDYRGATAWYEDPSIFETAVNPVLVANPKILEREKKNNIMKVIVIPPEAPFQAIHGDTYDYRSECVFHETAHIEEMGIRDWPNKGEIPAFPSKEQFEQFAQVIRSASFFPEYITEQILAGIDRFTLGELYAAVVDREAQRLYHSEAIEKKDEALLQRITDGTLDRLTEEDLARLLESPHKKGGWLAMILEKKFHDFRERKQFLQELMREKLKSKNRIVKSA